MYNIGVDVGGTKIAIGLVNENGKIVDRDMFWNNIELTNESMLRNVTERVDKLIIQNKLKISDINSIGIGFPSKVFNDGTVDAPNISFQDYNLLAEIKKIIDNIPVYIENDANCATIAEYVYGSLRGSPNSILITLGTGIGGGIIINGNIYTGHNGVAAELGHQVISMDGPKCGCGRHGCWETYGSTKALVSRIKEDIENYKNSEIYELIEGDAERITAKVFFDAIDKGDEYAKIMLKEHAKYIATGIISLFQIFDPDMLAIGGGISAQGDKLLQPVIEAVVIQIKDAVYTVDEDRICIAELGNDAGIIGAAELYRMKR